MPDYTSETERKLFLGGICSTLQRDELIQYFERFGVLTDAVIMRHPDGRSKGFGFVTYAQVEDTNVCLNNAPHKLAGKIMDVKRATPREDMAAAQSKEAKRKIFLGGLDNETTTEDLNAYFQSYGVIEDAVVMRYSDTGNSKGFGFVTFSRVEEADRCIAENPHFLDGKSIECTRAMPRGTDVETPIQQTNSEKQKRKLFIGNVSYDTTTEDLESYFEKYGEIDDCVVMKNPNGTSRGFGFVTYSLVEELDECQRNRPHVINGRTLDCKRANAKDGERDNENSVDRLFVGGLFGLNVTDEDLKEYFLKYGNIVSVDFEKFKQNDKERNFAFVQFEDYDAVDKAVFVNDHSINGRKVHVAKAQPKGSKNSLNGLGRIRRNEMNGIQPGHMSNRMYGRGFGNDILYNNMQMNLSNRIKEEANMQMNLLNRMKEEAGIGSNLNYQTFGIGNQGANQGVQGFSRGFQEINQAMLMSGLGFQGSELIGMGNQARFGQNTFSPMRNQISGAFRKRPY